MLRKILKNIFLRNWGLKLFSFLLAAVLWFALIPEEKLSSEKMMSIPLDLHNIPPNMEVVEKPPSTVDVKIKAPNRLINQITPERVRAALNLSQARVDLNEFPLNKNMITVPEGAEVLDIYPSQVNLKLEMTREIPLDVEPNFIGELPEGLIISKIEVIPAQVTVKGPESKVKETYKVRTRPIDRSSLTQSIEIEADLIPPLPDLKISSPVTRVKVRIIIEEKAQEESKKEEKDQQF